MAAGSRPGRCWRPSEGQLHERLVPQGTRELQLLAQDINALTERTAHRERQLTHSVTTETIDALLGGIAHEINNPLSYLTINEKRLADGLSRHGERDDLPRDVHAWAQKAGAWSRRNLAGLNRLGIITAALREVVRTDGQERDVNLLVHATVGITHYRFPPEMDTSLQLQAKRHAHIDGSVLFHALHGLLLDVASRSAESRTLTITTHDEPDHVQVRVRYGGPPPPDEVLQLIAEPAPGDAHGPVRIQNVHRALAGQGGALACERRGGATEWVVHVPTANGAT